MVKDDVNETNVKTFQEDLNEIKALQELLVSDYRKGNGNQLMNGNSLKDREKNRYQLGTRKLQANIFDRT